MCSSDLGWKLASVLRGASPPELLATYSSERQAIARELIDFDREWAALLSASQNAAPSAAAAGQVQDYFQRHGRYTAGTATRYTPSLLTASSAYQRLASGLPIGMRLHSAPVIRLADAKPVQLGSTIKADGRWEESSQLAARRWEADHGHAATGRPSETLYSGLMVEPSRVRR